MMKYPFILFLLSCSLISWGQDNNNLQKVAVYVTGSENDGLNEFMGAYLVNAITQSGDYLAVERTTDFIKELNKEQEYQRTGAVNDDQISQLGKQFGVQYKEAIGGFLL